MASSEKELFMRFASLFDQGKDEELQALISEKLSEDPESASALFWKGVVADSKSDIGGAVESFERAIKSSPNTPLFYVSLAQSLEHKQTYGILFGSGEGDPDLTARIDDCWKKAIELAPENAKFKCSFVEFLIGSRRFSEALDLAHEARKIAPEDEIVRKTWLRSNLAFGARILNEPKVDPGKCLQAINEVLKELPQHKEARFLAGLCLLKMDNLEESVKFLEESLPPVSEDRKTSISIAFGDLGKKLLEKGDLKTAEHVALKGKEIDPDNSRFDDLLKRIKKKKTATGEVEIASGVSAPMEIPIKGETEKGFFQPFQKSLLDIVSPILENFPDDVRGLLKDLAFEVENVNLKKVRELQEKLWEFKLSESLKTDPQKIALTNFWYFVQKKAYESGNDLLFEIYFHGLEEFSNNLGKFCHYSLLTAPVAWLFEITDRFLISFYDSGLKSVFNLDDLLETHSKNLGRIIVSPNFKVWAGRDFSKDFLKRKINSWSGHLGNFLLNRRQRPFLILLKLSLELQKAVPDSILLPETFRFLGKFISSEFSKSACDEIDNLIRSICIDCTDEFKKLAVEYLGNRSDSTSPSEIPDSGEPGDLTVEYAYRTALEEIVGDGVVTDEEKDILRNLRAQLEISQSDFQRVFEDVKERKKKNLIPVLSRDFSAEEFLFKVLTKTIEDGKITKEEKEIVQKICDALKLDKNMFARVFQKAKEQKAFSSVSGNSMNFGGDTQIRELYQALEEKAKFRKLLSGEFFHKSIEEGPQKESPQFFGRFFYNPELLSLPLLALFVKDDFSESARLQLKGEKIDVCSTTDLAQVSESLLFIQNPTLDHSILIPSVVIREELERFKEGIAATDGKYVIGLIANPSLSPVLLVRKDGDIDLSGTLYKAMNQLKNGAFGEAFSELKKLNQSNPRMHNVLYYMGLCLKNLAQRGINPAKNYEDAIRFYRAELELNPASDKAMNSMGVALKQQEKWEEALQWLEKAFGIAPSCIPILATLVTTHYNFDVMQNKSGTAVPDYLLKYLGKAFSIHPEHPLVTELVSKFGSIFHTDLRAQFKYQTIDTRSQ